MPKALRAAARVWTGLLWLAMTGCGTPVTNVANVPKTVDGLTVGVDAGFEEAGVEDAGVEDAGDGYPSGLPEDASGVMPDAAGRRGADGEGAASGADDATGPADSGSPGPADGAVSTDAATAGGTTDAAGDGGSTGGTADVLADAETGGLTDVVADATGGTTGPDATGADAAGNDAAKADTGTGDPGTGDSSAGDTKTDTAAPAAEAGPCKKAGAESCGEPLGADGGSLYLCKSGKWKLLKTCTKACESMPNGVPDRCKEDLAVPAALVQILDVKPYVEQSCAPHSHPDWPYAAKKCTYSTGGKTATVVTATPSAAKVAAWIVDSAAYIPALWSLRYLDPPSYNSGLQKLATAVLGQSSRIFPVEGGVLENMTGTAWVNHPFYHGVTDGCTWGCYCRINSLHRSEWCAYQAFLGKQTESQCLAKVGSSGLTKAWGDQCLGNHIEAWKESFNHHFRAKARVVHKDVAAQCATAVACSPSKVLALMHESLFK